MTVLYELPVSPAEGRKLGGFTCASCRRVLCVQPGELPAPAQAQGAA